MSENRHVVRASMQIRDKKVWTPIGNSKKHSVPTRIFKSPAIYAIAILCLCGTIALIADSRDGEIAVMNHLSAGFEYDETLGQLQYVSNILPDSAMVFLNSTDEAQTVAAPVQAAASHDWTQEEPWFEYDCLGEVSACMAGEVITIVGNRENEFTVRMVHENGYESIYSGLTNVSVEESGRVDAGSVIGNAGGFAAFELRRDGLSILPVFGEGAK